MKKGWIIALALLLIGIGGAYIWYSRQTRRTTADGDEPANALKPRLAMSTLNITHIDDDEIRMRVKLLIDNPLPVGFKASRLGYTILMANTPIVEDTYAKPIEIKSGDSTTVTLPITVRSKKLAQVMKALDRDNRDSTTYTVRSRFDLTVPLLGQRTFQSTITRRLPTIYLPQISVEDIDLGRLGLKRTDVAAKVAVLNKNVFPLQFTDTHYTITIAGKTIATGDQPEPILIKKQATTPVVFPVTVKPGQSLGLLPRLLFNKKNTPFLVTFRSTLIDKDSSMAFNHSTMRAVVRGTLADFKKD